MVLGRFFARPADSAATDKVAGADAGGQAAAAVKPSTKVNDAVEIVDDSEEEDDSSEDVSSSSSEDDSSDDDSDGDDDGSSSSDDDDDGLTIDPSTVSAILGKELGKEEEDECPDASEKLQGGNDDKKDENDSKTELPVSPRRLRFGWGAAKEESTTDGAPSETADNSSALQVADTTEPLVSPRRRRFGWGATTEEDALVTGSSSTPSRAESTGSGRPESNAGKAREDTVVAEPPVSPRRRRFGWGAAKEEEPTTTVPSETAEIHTITASDNEESTDPRSAFSEGDSENPVNARRRAWALLRGGNNEHMEDDDASSRDDAADSEEDSDSESDDDSSYDDDTRCSGMSSELSEEEADPDSKESAKPVSSESNLVQNDPIVDKDCLSGAIDVEGKRLDDAARSRKQRANDDVRLDKESKSTSCVQTEDDDGESCTSCDNYEQDGETLDHETTIEKSDEFIDSSLGSGRVDPVAEQANVTLSLQETNASTSSVRHTNTQSTKRIPDGIVTEQLEQVDTKRVGDDDFSKSSCDPSDCCEESSNLSHEFAGRKCDESMDDSNNNCGSSVSENSDSAPAIHKKDPKKAPIEENDHKSRSELPNGSESESDQSVSESHTSNLASNDASSEQNSTSIQSQGDERTYDSAVNDDSRNQPIEQRRSSKSDDSTNSEADLSSISLVENEGTCSQKSEEGSYSVDESVEDTAHTQTDSGVARTQHNEPSPDISSDSRKAAPQPKKSTGWFGITATEDAEVKGDLEIEKPAPTNSAESSSIFGMLSVVPTATKSETGWFTGSALSLFSTVQDNEESHSASNKDAADQPKSNETLDRRQAMRDMKSAESAYLEKQNDDKGSCDPKEKKVGDGGWFTGSALSMFSTMDQGEIDSKNECSTLTKNAKEEDEIEDPRQSFKNIKSSEKSWLGGSALSMFSYIDQDEKPTETESPVHVDKSSEANAAEAAPASWFNTASLGYFSSAAGSSETDTLKQVSGSSKEPTDLPETDAATETATKKASFKTQDANQGSDAGLSTDGTSAGKELEDSPTLDPCSSVRKSSSSAHLTEGENAKDSSETASDSALRTTTRDTENEYSVAETTSKTSSRKICTDLDSSTGSHTISIEQNKTEPKSETVNTDIAHEDNAQHQSTEIEHTAKRDMKDDDSSVENNSRTSSPDKSTDLDNSKGSHISIEQKSEFESDSNNTTDCALHTTNRYAEDEYSTSETYSRKNNREISTDLDSSNGSHVSTEQNETELEAETAYADTSTEDNAQKQSNKFQNSPEHPSDSAFHAAKRDTEEGDSSIESKSRMICREKSTELDNLMDSYTNRQQTSIEPKSEVVSSSHNKAEHSSITTEIQDSAEISSTSQNRHSQNGAFQQETIQNDNVVSSSTADTRDEKSNFHDKTNCESSSAELTSNEQSASQTKSPLSQPSEQKEESIKNDTNTDTSGALKNEIIPETKSDESAPSTFLGMMGLVESAPSTAEPQPSWFSGSAMSLFSTVEPEEDCTVELKETEEGPSGRDEADVDRRKLLRDLKGMDSGTEDVAKPPESTTSTLFGMMGFTETDPTATAEAPWFSGSTLSIFSTMQSDEGENQIDAGDESEKNQETEKSDINEEENMTDSKQGNSTETKAREDINAEDSAVETSNWLTTSAMSLFSTVEDSGATADDAESKDAAASSWLTGGTLGLFSTAESANFPVEDKEEVEKKVEGSPGTDEEEGGRKVEASAENRRASFKFARVQSFRETYDDLSVGSKSESSSSSSSSSDSSDSSTSEDDDTTVASALPSQPKPFGLISGFKKKTPAVEDVTQSYITQRNYDKMAIAQALCQKSKTTNSTGTAVSGTSNATNQRFDRLAMAQALVQQTLQKDSAKVKVKKDVESVPSNNYETLALARALILHRDTVSPVAIEVCSPETTPSQKFSALATARALIEIEDNRKQNAGCGSYDISDSEEQSNSASDSDDDTKPYKLVVKEAPLLRLENVTATTRSVIPEKNAQKTDRKWGRWFGRRQSETEADGDGETGLEEEEEEGGMQKKSNDEKDPIMDNVAADTDAICTDHKNTSTGGSLQEPTEDLAAMLERVEEASRQDRRAALKKKASYYSVLADPTAEDAPDDSMSLSEHSAMVTSVLDGTLNDESESIEDIVEVKGIARESAPSVVDAAIERDPPKRKKKKAKGLGIMLEQNAKKITRHGDEMSVGTMNFKAGNNFGRVVIVSGSNDAFEETSITESKNRPWESALRKGPKRNVVPHNFSPLDAIGSLVEKEEDTPGDSDDSSSVSLKSKSTALPVVTEEIEDESGDETDDDDEGIGEEDDNIAELLAPSDLEKKLASAEAPAVDFEDMWDTVSCDMSTALEFERNKRKKNHEKEKKRQRRQIEKVEKSNAARRLRLFEKRKECEGAKNQKPSRLSHEFVDAIHKVFDDGSVNSLESNSDGDLSDADIPDDMSGDGSCDSLYLLDTEEDADMEYRKTEITSRIEDNGGMESVQGSKANRNHRHRSKRRHGDSVSLAPSRVSKQSKTSKTSKRSRSNRAEIDAAEIFMQEVEKLKKPKVLTVQSLRQEMVDRRGTSVALLKKEFTIFKRKKDERKTYNNDSQMLDFGSLADGRGFELQPAEFSDAPVLPEGAPAQKTRSEGLGAQLSRWASVENVSELDDLATVHENAPTVNLFGATANLAKKTGIHSGSDNVDPSKDGGRSTHPNGFSLPNSTISSKASKHAGSGLSKHVSPAGRELGHGSGSVSSGIHKLASPTMGLPTLFETPNEHAEEPNNMFTANFSDMPMQSIQEASDDEDDFGLLASHGREDGNEDDNDDYSFQSSHSKKSFGGVSNRFRLGKMTHIKAPKIGKTMKKLVTKMPSMPKRDGGRMKSGGGLLMSNDEGW